MLYFLDLIGVAVFAISGALAGLNRGLDLFGVTVLAAVTAIGGGTLRDVLLHRDPIFWVGAPSYIYTILAAVILALFGHSFFADLEQPMLIADALGLGLFAISGAQVAEEQKRAAVVVVLMGTITGVAGGVIRDLLSGVVPVLLRRDIYASAAAIGVVVYLISQALRLRRTSAFIVSASTIVLLRLIALRYGLQLPNAKSLGF